MPRSTPTLPLSLRIALATAATAALVACGTTGPTTGSSNPGAAAQAKPLFIRPASGTTLARFNGKSNKGLDIAGSAGDPVLAAADGRVVYAGGQLRGYGNMLIVKHNETFITAYAHNQALLVKENDIVRQGQKIAEMGKSEADRVKLHFEIRKDGTAVDPEPYLSGRLR
jgi:lipoprotein NlpD